MYEIRGTYKNRAMVEKSANLEYIINVWHVLSRDEDFKGYIREKGHSPYCSVRLGVHH